MTNEQTGTLVLKDNAGNYFLVPQATLEQGRVPAEHTAELERLLADSDDVSGHHPAIFLGVGLILVGVGLVIEGQSDTDSGKTYLQLHREMISAAEGVQ
jgi:hypothetical protein